VEATSQNDLGSEQEQGSVLTFSQTCVKQHTQKERI
jgi:hypothetical protein